MPGIKFSISDRVGGEPLTIQLGQGYHLKFTDFGLAGVMVMLYRPDRPDFDREEAVMIPHKSVDDLLHWVSKTVGRQAIALPIQTQAVLKGILAKDGIEKLIPRADRNVLKQAVSILESLDGVEEDSGNFNNMSRACRALRR